MLFADSPSQILREMLSWEFAGFITFWTVILGGGWAIWDAVFTNPRKDRLRVAELNAATAAMELERAKAEMKAREVRDDARKEI